jgi:hypothetical protein
MIDASTLLLHILGAFMSYKEERFLPTQSHKSDIHVAKIPVANPMTTIVGEIDKLHVKLTADLMRETKKCTKIIWEQEHQRPQQNCVLLVQIIYTSLITQRVSQHGKHKVFYESGENQDPNLGVSCNVREIMIYITL